MTKIKLKPLNFARKLYMTPLNIYVQNTLVTFATPSTASNPNAILVSDTFSLNALIDAVALHPEGIELIFKNELEIRTFIATYFQSITAAGGIVVDSAGKLLFIFRRGKWDLPKGKMEANENVELCAQREIEEETGLRNLILQKKLTDTYHVYPEKAQMVLKTSHWFLFRIQDAQQTTPQVEEDITEVRWFGRDELEMPLSNSYQNILTVVSSYLHTI
jgi:8-oxo-dGTP pyrophosphatase MutT (NUDIX family)